MVRVTSSVIKEYDLARSNDYEEYRRERKKRVMEAEVRRELDRRRRRRRRKNKLKNRESRKKSGEERKKKEKKRKGSESKVAAGESLSVCLITKMPLKIELWKLKTLKMCFQFP